MLGTIIKRELHDNILSVRFFIIFVIVTVLMSSSGLLFIKKYTMLQEEYSEGFFNNRQELSSQSGRLRNLIHFYQTFMTSPNPLRFMADGDESELPNSAQLSIWNIRDVDNIGSGNPFMSGLGDIDIVFIIQVIMSFVALTLTFNSICGEKESGTLRLSLANSIPRDRLLLGKYISSMIIITIPFAIGLLINMVIINISPVITLEFSQWLQIIAVGALSVLYLSFFVLLGMAVSARTGSTPVSLVMLLLIWVILVVVIPNNWAGILTGKLASVPAPAEIEEEARRASEEVRSRYPSDYGTNYEIGDPRNVPHVKVSMEAHDAFENVYENYRNRKIGVIEYVRMLTRISPAAVYRYASETAAGTGLAHVKHFLRRVDVYKRELEQFFHEQDTKDSASQHLYYHVDYVSQKPFQAVDVPEFHEPPMPVSEGLGLAIYDILILVLFNVILFAFAHVSFLRYDVR
ncbi:MAG: ABC transporter permease subunit [Candidatus Latescibacteria bacterium]|jgi:ABC-2 type transport system permease protein|nr:ABC transporter permease subunit [Candidatus Latescibacterota bacterium]